MSNQSKINPKACFWLKLFVLFLPINIMVVIYFINDPLMVLHSYKRFDRSSVMLGEAYVGWQNYLAHRDSIPFNSFILGNSCTMAFTTNEWEKNLQPGDRAVRFFDNGESLGGINQKLEALDAVGASLKNVIVVANGTLLMDIYPKEANECLFSPEVANISKLEFQLKYLQHFIDPHFSIPYIKYLITQKYDASMKGVISPCIPIREPYTNNFINPREKEIEHDGERYWMLHKKEFKAIRTPGKEDARTIYSGQMKLLRNIKRLSDKHETSLKFVICPDYYQTRTNHQDLALLRSVLGDAAVWDFTGVNEYTTNLRYFYEPKHFRPMLGAKILQQIYQTKQQ